MTRYQQQGGENYENLKVTTKYHNFHQYVLYNVINSV